MAGPRFLATGGVVDPYANLQNAVSNVGQIYQNYEENERRDADFRAKEEERNRIKSMREFATNYDSRVGEDYRGINANMRPLVEQSEAQVKQRWQAANPQATAEQSAAFDNELRNVRKTLATAEDVAATVTNDYLRAGFSPEEADAYGRQAATGYGSRGAALAQAQAEADARNQAADKMSQRLLDLYKVQSQSDNASIRALGSSSGSGVRSGVKTGSVGASSFANPAKLNALQEYLSEEIGGDSREAIASMEQGLSLYNEKAKANGGVPLTFEQAQNVALSNISRGGAFTDNKALYSDPADFAALLTTQYGPADATNRANTQTGGAIDRQSLITNARTRISNAEREAILNPSRTVVNPEQIARQQVASAYARLFPQAAEENRVAATRTGATAASAPSRITAAVNQSARYRVTPPTPVAAGSTRGTGFVAPQDQTQQVTPAGTTSSPEEQLANPARALAQELFLSQNNPNGVDTVRELQRLRIQNPKFYEQVIEEQSLLQKNQEILSNLDQSLSQGENRIAQLRRYMASQNPETLSTERELTLSPRGITTSPYERYLQDQERLRQAEQEQENVRLRRDDLRSTLPYGQQPNLDRLQQLLKSQ